CDTQATADRPRAGPVLQLLAQSPLAKPDDRPAPPPRRARRLPRVAERHPLSPPTAPPGPGPATAATPTAGSEQTGPETNPAGRSTGGMAASGGQGKPNCVPIRGTHCVSIRGKGS